VYAVEKRKNAWPLWEQIMKLLGNWLRTRCNWERNGNWKGMLRESIGDFLRTYL
jgi:hypothetical protein